MCVAISVSLNLEHHFGTFSSAWVMIIFCKKKTIANCIIGFKIILFPGIKEMIFSYRLRVKVVISLWLI